MKSTLIIIIVVAYFIGGVGLPVVAFTCPMTGQSGVTVDIDASLPACAVGACCETDTHEATVRLEGNDTCCDFTVEGCATDSQTVLTAFKYGVGHHPQAGHIHLDVLATRSHAVTTSSNPVARSPINSPLLI